MYYLRLYYILITQYHLLITCVVHGKLYELLVNKFSVIRILTYYLDLSSKLGLNESLELGRQDFIIVLPS
jgi:hypothetical protein